MNKLAVVFFAIMIFISCSSDDSNDELLGSWSLVEVTGGISGASCTFDTNKIIWTFRDSDMVIENDFSLFDCAINTSQESYTYSTIENNRGLFLVIDGNERGSITFTENGFTLNPNEHSEHELADAPFSIFEK